MGAQPVFSSTSFNAVNKASWISFCIWLRSVNKTSFFNINHRSKIRWPETFYLTNKIWYLFLWIIAYDKKMIRSRKENSFQLIQSYFPLKLRYINAIFTIDRVIDLRNGINNIIFLTQKPHWHISFIRWILRCEYVISYNQENYKKR